MRGFGLDVDSSGNDRQEIEKRVIERMMKWVAAGEEDEAIVSIS